VYNNVPAWSVRWLLGFAGLLLAGSVEAQDCSGGVFFVSAAVVGGSAIYDIATAAKSARHYNTKHLAIAPIVNPGRRSYGVMASWPVGRTSRLPPPRSVAAPAQKSPGTAFALSFATTAVPMVAGGLASSEAGGVAFLGGLVIGPSVGHLYAGQVGRGLGTILLRGAGTVIGLASIIPCVED
jgi:hypothetical protein